MIKKLYNLRIKYNMSLNDISKKLNISKSYYWQIENKKRKLSYSMAKDIAKLFKLKPDDIFYDEIS